MDGAFLIHRRRRQPMRHARVGRRVVPGAFVDPSLDDRHFAGGERFSVLRHLRLDAGNLQDEFRLAPCPALGHPIPRPGATPRTS
jgi:hypothetical protein